MTRSAPRTSPCCWLLSARLPLLVLLLVVVIAHFERGVVQGEHITDGFVTVEESDDIGLSGGVVSPSALIPNHPLPDSLIAVPRPSAASLFLLVDQCPSTLLGTAVDSPRPPPLA